MTDTLFVNEVTSRTSVANSIRLIWSCVRIRAWTKRRDASASSARSLKTLPLVSMASVRLSGSSDWRSKIAISWGRLSSAMAKSWRVNPPTIAPFGSVTLTKTLTSFTSMRSVMPSCATRKNAPNTAKAAAMRNAFFFIDDEALRSIVRLQAQLCREGLAGGPHGAIHECLFLPDRHGCLKGVDKPAAGIEGLRSVGRCYDDQDAGLAYFEATEAVDDGYVAHGEARPRFLRKLAHLTQRHLFVGFVVEMQSPTAAGVFAHDAVEDNHRAVFALLGFCDEFVGINGLAGEISDDVRPQLKFFLSVRRARRGTAGDRRQKTHFIAMA